MRADLAHLQKQIDHLTERVDKLITLTRLQHSLRWVWEGVRRPDPDPDPDGLLELAVMRVRDHGSVSATLLQRWFHIGYARAAGLLAQLEARGVVAPKSSTHENDDDQETG
jgi:DNA segregation ATPase FtsK/SpoIIIE-like protein